MKMPQLTTSQFWVCAAILIGGLIALAAGFLIHWRKIDKDILAEDRRRLKERYDFERNRLRVIAEEYAEEKAIALYKQRVHTAQVPVHLVNESDINWGD
jgi:hypothetical protein